AGAASAALAPEVRRPLRGLLVWATMSCLASQRAQLRLPRESSPREQHAPLDGWRAWRAARRIDRIPRKVGRGGRECSSRVITLPLPPSSPVVSSRLPAPAPALAARWRLP